MYEHDVLEADWIQILFEDRLPGLSDRHNWCNEHEVLSI